MKTKNILLALLTLSACEAKDVLEDVDNTKDAAEIEEGNEDQNDSRGGTIEEATGDNRFACQKIAGVYEDRYTGGQMDELNTAVISADCTIKSNLCQQSWRLNASQVDPNFLYWSDVNMQGDVTRMQDGCLTKQIETCTLHFDEYLYDSRTARYYDQLRIDCQGLWNAGKRTFVRQ